MLSYNLDTAMQEVYQMQAKRKIFGRQARIKAIIDRILSLDNPLPDMCIDIIYSIIVNY